MLVKVTLNDHMAGDHGCHPPGSTIEVPLRVARQIVAGRHGLPVVPLPELTDAELKQLAESKPVVNADGWGDPDSSRQIPAKKPKA